MAWYDGIWSGLAFESAGEIGIGISTQEGLMISIGDLVKTPTTVRWMTFEQRAATVGVGLGGSFSGNFVIGANAATPQDFDGASKSIDFSIDMGQAGLGKYLRSAPEMIELEAVARGFDQNLMRIAKGLEKYEKNAYKIKDAAEGILKNRDAIFDVGNGEPGIIALPLPGSLGLRFSIKMKFETTQITDWGTLSVVLV